MRRVTVEVTAEDIAKGERERCMLCPIALALGRHGDSPWADYTALGLNGGPAGRTPLAVRRFMTDFDDGEPVQPFTFEVELP